MDTELLLRETHVVKNDSVPLLLIAARLGSPLRISSPVLPTRPLLRGDRAYLRALRAAEMKAWQASGGDVFHPQCLD